MNQLAIAIRNLSDGGEDSKDFCLTPVELYVLRSFINIIKTPTTKFASSLKLEVNPTEWLIPPSYNPT